MYDNKLFVALMATHTLHDIDKPSTRRRVMINHKIINKEANTKDFPLVCLEGQVVREADGFEPACRFTNTSPIKSCKYIGDNTAIVSTCSGSEYQINCSQAQAELLNHCNPWIDGDNWKTI